MTNEEILKAIRRCARKLKRTPRLRDLAEAGIGRGLIETRWKNLRNALRQAGIEANRGFQQRDATLLLDWAEVARKLGRIPSVLEYEKEGRFCHAPLHSRVRWRNDRPADHRPHPGPPRVVEELVLGHRTVRQRPGVTPDVLARVERPIPESEV